MATTTLASSAAERHTSTGGINIFRRRQRLGADLLALLVLLSGSLLGLAVGYAQPTDFEVGVAGRYATPYLQQFHEAEAPAGSTTPAYRWTRERSTVLAPGLGRGLWQTSLTLSSPQPAGQPKQVVVVTDSQRWAIQLQPEPRVYQLLTPSAGDLTLALETSAASVGSDPRILGVVFGGVAFEPVLTAAFPPLLLLLYTLAALTLAFLTMRLIGVPSWLALIGPLLGLLVLAWAVATNRAPIGLLMPRLAILSVFGLVSVLVLQWVWRWLARLGRLEPEPWLLPALLVTFYVGFWLKATGLLYPYSYTKDIPWHVRDIQLVLGGRFSEFYLPSAFSYGKMPVREWGNNPPLLPYSPFFHIVAASFAVFPWAMDMSVNVFSVIFDTNRVIFIAAMALALGLKSRGAFLAALLYAVTPFTFMLHSWGNVPTTFGIWVTLFATTLLILTFGRWHERHVFVLLTLGLLAAFLFYFVMAVFTGFFVLFLVLGLLFVPHARVRVGQPGQIWPLLGSAALALVLSIVIYYGFFIPEMIERTLPYVTRTVAGGQTNTGQDEHISFVQYLANHYRHMGYISYPVRHGVWLPVLLTLPGLWVLRKQRFALLVLGAWLLVALLFFFVGLRVSMVDKYIFYAAPVLAICTAAFFERLWARNRFLPIAITAVYLLTFISAMDIWIQRLQRVTG